MTILLIDGENFKGYIKDIFEKSGKKRPVWHEYDFKGLLERVLGNTKIDKIIFYFAKIKEDFNTKEKSKQLIEEQRLLKTHLEKQGFEVVLAGRVRGHLEKTNDFSDKNKQVIVFKEKGVDVKIAVDMVSWACDKKVKKIILGSSDSDLQPAVKEIKERGVECVYLGFESQPNKGLSYTCAGGTVLIRNSELMEHEQIRGLF